MKATSSPPHDSQPGRLAGAARAWDRFLFAPADPTPLGIMRIMCGVLVLYLHIAYTADLQELFGKDAWLSQEAANRMRHEEPFRSMPDDWQPVPFSVVTPEDPDVRTSFVQFIRRTLDNPQAKQKVLAFLDGRADLPPATEVIVPNYVIVAYRHDLPAGYPTSRRNLARYMRDLDQLEPAKRNHILDYLNEWRADPREVEQLGAVGHTYWSIWFHVSDPAWMMMIHAGVLIVILMFTVGLGTRVTSWLTWALALSYVHRSPISLFGCDVMMNILLLYLMIGPSGAVLSVDRLLRDWWARKKAEAEGTPPPPRARVEPKVSANLALRLIQLHFCIIYLSAGTAKLMGNSWWNGTAIYYTLANPEFSLIRFGFFEAMLRWLCQHRWLWEIVMAGGSYFTLALEIGFPFLVWNRRLRPYLLTAAFLLHLGIAIFMGLFVFQLLMGTMVLAFVPASFFQRFLGKPGDEESLPDEASTSEDSAEPSKEVAVEP